MNGAEFHLSVFGVQQVQSGSLASLIGVVNRRADSDRCCCARVGGTEIKGQTLERVRPHIILIHDCDITRRPLGSLQIRAVNCVSY